MIDCTHCANAHVFDSSGTTYWGVPAGVTTPDGLGMRCIVHDWSVGGDKAYNYRVLTDCDFCTDANPRRKRA